MSSAKRYLLTALSFCLVVFVITALSPRAVHAITATLVQVVNTNSNPVPVHSVDGVRTPYYFSTTSLTCQFTNQCYAEGPAVPTGKQLHVTRITGQLHSQNISIAMVMFSTVDDQGHPYFFGQVPIVNAAYYGTAVSFNQELDVTIAEGKSPHLELGTPPNQSFISTSFGRFTIVGYLEDAQ